MNQSLDELEILQKNSEMDLPGLKIYIYIFFREIQIIKMFYYFTEKPTNFSVLDKHQDRSPRNSKYVPSVTPVTRVTEPLGIMKNTKPRVIGEQIIQPALRFNLSPDTTQVALNKQLERFECIVRSQEKLMNQFNVIMGQAVRMAEANAEAERLRLKHLEELKNRDTQSLTNNSIFQKESDLNNTESSQKNKLDQKSESGPCGGAAHSSRVSQNSSQILIKRDYKLTQKSNFDLWFDCLKSELMSNDLLDVINSDVVGPENLTVFQSFKRKSLVRDVIINHLDEGYHKRILHLTEPKEIISKLENYKKSEINVTPSSVRAQLYQIKMKNNKKVNDFVERFDSIIRDYEAVGVLWLSLNKKNALPFIRQ